MSCTPQHSSVLPSTPLHSPSLLNQQFLGGDAVGGGDAEEVGAAGPGGDVEGDFEFGVRGSELGDFVAKDVGEFDACYGQGGSDVHGVAGRVGADVNLLVGVGRGDAVAEGAKAHVATPRIEEGGVEVVVLVVAEALHLNAVAGVGRKGLQEHRGVGGFHDEGAVRPLDGHAVAVARAAVPGEDGPGVAPVGEVQPRGLVAPRPVGLQYREFMAP